MMPTLSFFIRSMVARENAKGRSCLPARSRALPGLADHFLRLLRFPGFFAADFLAFPAGFFFFAGLPAVFFGTFFFAAGRVFRTTMASAFFAGRVAAPSSVQPWASRTAIIAERMLFQVCCCIM